MSEIYRDIKVLLSLSRGEIGIRKGHKDIILPRVIGYLHELLSLKRKISEKRLIELPCKVGDAVYIHHRAFADTIIKCEVIGFAWWRTDGFCVKVHANEYNYGNLDISFDKFRKSVFLTRKEAEQALKE